MNTPSDSPISAEALACFLDGATPSLTPLASVVIPTCNRPEMLKDCLELVARAVTAAGARIEVIVTDDSADSRSHELLLANYPWARWVRGPRRGPAANRNAGAAAAAGAWIIFTDDDCLADPRWLRAYLDALDANPTSNVFEGKTVADRELRRLDEESPLNETGGYLWSCNMAIRRELFDRLGGFCESFPYATMEDVDLRLRLQEQGETFPFVPDAVIATPFGPPRALASR
jgi:GT2 family glycosyltransferase